MITFVEARNNGKAESDLGIAERDFRRTLSVRLRDIGYYPSDISPKEYARDYNWRLGGWVQALSSKLPNFEKRIFWYTGQENIEALPSNDDEIFLLSISCSTNYHVCKEFVEKARKLHPHAKILVGGLHANIAPEQTFADLQPDLLFAGEADEHIAEIISEKDWGQPRMIKNKATARKESLDDDWKLYFHGTKPVGLRTPKLLTSRDCPYRCNFCSIEKREAIREIPAEKIVRSLTTLKHSTEMEIMFYLESPVPFHSQARSAELNAIFAEMGMKWYCDSRITSPTTRSQKLFEAMYSSGCRHIFFGVETSVQHVSDTISKKIDVRNIVPLFRQAKNAGLRVHAGFIVGLPGQSEDDAKEDLDFIIEIMDEGLLDIAYYQYLTIYPNTQVFRDPEKYGVALEGYDLENIEDYPMYSTNHFSRGKIMELYLGGLAEIVKRLAYGH